MNPLLWKWTLFLSRYWLQLTHACHFMTEISTSSKGQGPQGRWLRLCKDKAYPDKKCPTAQLHKGYVAGLSLRTWKIGFKISEKDKKQIDLHETTSCIQWEMQILVLFTTFLSFGTWTHPLKSPPAANFKCANL